MPIYLPRSPSNLVTCPLIDLPNLSISLPPFTTSFLHMIVGGVIALIQYSTVYY